MLLQVGQGSSSTQDSIYLFFRQFAYSRIPIPCGCLPKFLVYESIFIVSITAITPLNSRRCRRLDICSRESEPSQEISERLFEFWRSSRMRALSYRCCRPHPLPEKMNHGCVRSRRKHTRGHKHLNVMIVRESQ